MMDGVQRILFARAGHHEAGHTAEHDATVHHNGDLARAASAIAHNAGCPNARPPWNWPWPPREWKPTDDAIADLTKAGGLIAAEIDRLLALDEARADRDEETAPHYLPCGCTRPEQAENDGYGVICAEHWTGPPLKSIWAAARAIAMDEAGVDIDDVVVEEEDRQRWFELAESALVAAHRADLTSTAS